MRSVLFSFRRRRRRLLPFIFQSRALVSPCVRRSSTKHCEIVIHRHSLLLPVTSYASLLRSSPFASFLPFFARRSRSANQIFKYETTELSMIIHFLLSAQRRAEPAHIPIDAIRH